MGGKCHQSYLWIGGKTKRNKAPFSFGIYRSANGEVYEAHTTAKHSETNESLVVYRALNASEESFAMPLTRWNASVTIDGKAQPRFVLIAGSVDNMDSLPLFSIIEDVADAMQHHVNISTAYFHLPNGEVVYFHEDVLRIVFDADDNASIEAAGATLPEWEREQFSQALSLKEHENEYLLIPPSDSDDEYEIMERFVNKIPLPPRMRERLQDAIQGKGPFRRFKDAVVDMKLDEHWYAYRDAAYRRMAREWCDAHDIAWGVKMISNKQEES